MTRTIDMAVWQGRVDERDGASGRRWHQGVTAWRAASAPPDPLDPTARRRGVGIAGFACDAGVARNHGRVGARDGPVALRRQLANLPLPVEHAGPLYDAGDIVCEGDALEAAQGELAALVATLLGQGVFPVVLGGGHETAWGCYQGLAAALAGTDALAGLGVVNFDAHFDLRELPAPGRGTSGTPFRQIAQARRAQSLPFHYLCVGVSPASNTPALFTAAREFGVTTIADSELIWPNWPRVLTTLDAFLERCAALYLTVCLDAFPAAVAPGVSAPAARGIPVDFAFAMLEHMVARSRLRHGGRKLLLMDVVELNPRYDHDDATARLAARIVHDVVRPLLGPAA